jgi:hypothetical protein
MVTAFKLTNEATAKVACWYGDIPGGAAIPCDEDYKRRTHKLVTGGAA